MTVAREQGFPHWVAVGQIQRGWAVAVQGQGAAGMAEMHDGVTALRATGTALWRPEALALLADACGHVGQPTAGLHAVADALEAVHHTGERLSEAELYRLQGELLCQSPDEGGGAYRAPAPEAEACFQQALVLARQQEAKALELRTALSLARLWQHQGKCTEAYALLAPVYGWFTEGFDTADLQAAQAVLEAVA